MKLRCLAPALLLTGCPGPMEDVAEPLVDDTDVPTLPLTDEVFTTLDGRWTPNTPSEAALGAMKSGDLKVTDIDDFADNGLGATWDPTPTEHVERAELALNFAPGTKRTSLVWFWQAADPQIIDEESPIRFEGFTGIYRPQGHITTQVFASHVQTARRFSERANRPFDFALLAGDLTDGSQENELSWVVTAMVGGVLDPDTGIDDDPVPGPGNDYNDPFRTPGLGDVPWYAAIGNHETSYNGGFSVIDEALEAAAVGEEVYHFPLFANGFRDGSTLNANVVLEGPTPADPGRVPLRRHAVLETLRAAGGQPAGHGLTNDDVAAGRGYYAVHPIPERPIRLVVLDTVNTQGGLGAGAAGVLDEDQFTWFNAELADADAIGDLVIVMSHHRAEDFLGTSPVSGEDLIAALMATDNLVLHVTGHGHFNDADVYQTADRGYFQLMLSSTVDFPMHSRMFEIVNENNGYVSIYATNFDHNSPEDSLAHQARDLAAAKRAFPNVLGEHELPGLWEGDLLDQNLVLRVPITGDLEASLAEHDWPTFIETEAL
jgi:hypothetical protein